MSDLVVIAGNTWHPYPILPIPTLAALRDAVLARSVKRIPKWKFRVDTDILMQAQPRPEGRTKANREGLPWFDCFVVIHDAADGGMLKTPPQDAITMECRLTIHRDESWWFRFGRIGHGLGLEAADWSAVRERLIGLLPVAFATLRPALMLQPSCLFCGKMLTDPVSMARWIGPECAGTSSSSMPHTVILSDAASDMQNRKMLKNHLHR
jgi:Family of unknown function (DUF6011)